MSAQKGIVFVLITAVLLLLNISTVFAANFEVEILNSDNNYQHVSSYPYGVHTELVVASKTSDVRQFLPIILKVRVGDKLFTNTIPSDPTKVCRGADGCSIPGPVVKIEFKGQPLEILAIDKSGKNIAYFGENVPTGGKSLKDESPTAKPTFLPKSTTAPSTSPTATPSPIASPTISPSSKPQVIVSSDNTKKAVGGLSVTGSLALLWWYLTSRKPKNNQEKKEDTCPNNCKLGECGYSIEKVETSTFGFTPEEEKQAFNALDLTEYLGYTPKIGMLGGHTGAKLAIEVAKKYLKEEIKNQRKLHGVSLWATVTWFKCKKVECKKDQFGMDWEKNKTNKINLSPGGLFFHPTNEKAWDERKLLDPKNQHEIKMQVIRMVIEEAPGDCKDISLI